MEDFLYRQSINILFTIFYGRHVALDYLERKNICRKRSGILVDIQAEIVDYVQYQSGDILGSSTVEYILRVKRFTHAIDNVVLEKWCIFRRFTDFSAFHKQLRSKEILLIYLVIVMEYYVNETYQYV